MQRNKFSPFGERKHRVWLVTGKAGDRLPRLFAGNPHPLQRTKWSTVFLKNMNDFAAMKEVYATFFTGNPPARSGSSAHKSNGQNSLKKRLNSGLSSSLPIPQSRTNRITGGNTAECFVLCKGCGFPAKRCGRRSAALPVNSQTRYLLSPKGENFSLCVKSRAL